MSRQQAVVADTVRRLGTVAMSLVGAQCWVAYSLCADGGAGPLLWAEEDPRRCDAYFSHHFRNDPVAPHRFADAPVACLRQRFAHCPERARRYEAEFMQPYGLSDALDMLLPAGQGGAHFCVSLLRNAPHPPFAARDQHALAQLHGLAVQLLHGLPATPGCDARARLALRFPGLTPRELDVAAAIAEGMPNKLAARHAGISPATVKTHLQHIFCKCAIRNRSELARLAA